MSLRYPKPCADKAKSFKAGSAALLRILEVFKNVRGLITEHVLTYGRGKSRWFRFSCSIDCFSNYVVATGNFPRSSGNNLVARNFAHWAAIDMKGRQDATLTEISIKRHCGSWPIHQTYSKQQHHLCSSCHPQHTKRAISFSLALRIRRICFTDTKFTLPLNELRPQNLERGYGKALCLTHNSNELLIILALRAKY